MKFKLDENFGTRTTRVFLDSGHDVQTVRQEQLHGAPDRRLHEICIEEKRCLVTFDLDFANPLAFDPACCAGIAVIRAPHNPSIDLLEALIRDFLHALATNSIDGQLWIIEPGRIRIHVVDQGQ
jgi:predicted nuclease of predicted toxin-antitoxin system